MCEPEDGEDWYEPPCNKKHRVHYSCAKQWNDKQVATKFKNHCVLCRTEFNFEDGTKRTVEIKIDATDAPPVLPADAFGLDEKNVEMAPIDAKNRAADANNPSMAPPGGLILPPVMAPD